jgi:hypothetical protein
VWFNCAACHEGVTVLVVYGVVGALPAAEVDGLLIGLAKLTLLVDLFFQGLCHVWQWNKVYHWRSGV